MPFLNRRKQHPPEPHGHAPIRNLFDGFTVTDVQSRGLIEVVALTRNRTEPAELAVPTSDLQMTAVTNYGTMVLTNSSCKPMIVPMHIGFFQHGAQNHATSRTLVFQPGEEKKVKDCFCIQAAQGGLLQKSAQRFVMLPLALRATALAKSHVQGYNRLWEDIDNFTRKYGVARGGHLERFLRPNFGRLQPLRHGFESKPDQTGAAYFIAGQLAGIEIAPSPKIFAPMLPIYSMYCYGPSALLHERQGTTYVAEKFDLNGLSDVADLRRRLLHFRDSTLKTKQSEIEALLESDWQEKTSEQLHSFRVISLEKQPWSGQAVYTGNTLAALSVFRSDA